MKTKEFTAIGRKLLPYLPGFVVNGKMMFIPPVDDFLRGIYFENSSGTNDFYLRVFFLPLFVPQDCVSFTHGPDRLRRNNRALWHADDPNLLENLRETIRDEAIPFLNSISTLDGVLNNLKAGVDSDRPRVNSHILEALAYTLIKSGDYSSALTALAELKQRLDKSTTPWVVEQKARAQLIEEKLLQNPETALEQLETWKTETIHKLGLEKFR
jgi:hypothetical protein